MTRIDNSPEKRGSGRALWVLILVIVALIGLTWLTAPTKTTVADSGAAALAPGVIAPGPKPSAGLAHPGSMTMGLPNTDSRDNGTANAGREAPASDAPPAQTLPGTTSSGPPGSGSKPG